jgi:hypothetical protein
LGGAILICILCTSFTKNPFFDIQKIENELFMHRKAKHPKATLFSIPRGTHVHNKGPAK